MVTSPASLILLSTDAWNELGELLADRVDTAQPEPADDRQERSDVDEH